MANGFPVQTFVWLGHGDLEFFDILSINSSRPSAFFSKAECDNSNNNSSRNNLFSNDL